MPIPKSVIFIEINYVFKLYCISLKNLNRLKKIELIKNGFELKL